MLEVCACVPKLLKEQLVDREIEGRTVHFSVIYRIFFTHAHVLDQKLNCLNAVTRERDLNENTIL